MGANASSPHSRQNARQQQQQHQQQRRHHNGATSSSSSASGNKETRYIYCTTVGEDFTTTKTTTRRSKNSNVTASSRKPPSTVANAAAGVLASFRKTLIHQLLFRKSGHSSSQFTNSSDVASTHRVHPQNVHQSSSSTPIELKVHKSSSQRFKHQQQGTSMKSSMTTAPMAHFNDGDSITTSQQNLSRSSRHSLKSTERQVHKSNLRLPQANNQHLHPQNNGTSATTTHVRIRISCSDTLGETLRRCDVSTQTDQSTLLEQHQQQQQRQHSLKRQQNAIKRDRSFNQIDKENLSKSLSSSTGSKNLEKPQVCWSASSAASSTSSGVDVGCHDDPMTSSTSSNSTTSSVGVGGNGEMPISSEGGPSTKAVVTRRTTIQASTGELLECLGFFVRSKFHHIPGVTNTTVVTWMRAIDRSLISQGWQDTPFISPGTVVFVYMLLRDSTMPHPSARINLSPSSSANQRQQQYHTASETYDQSIKPTLFDLHCHINACLYVAFAYAGIEISYPQRPFNVVDTPFPPTPPTSTIDFWQRTLDITMALSEKMLRLNSDPLFFAKTFAELKSQGVNSVATNTISTSCTTASATTPAPTINYHHSYPSPPETNSNASLSPPCLSSVSSPTENTATTMASFASHHSRSAKTTTNNRHQNSGAAVLMTSNGNVTNNCRSSIITPGLLTAGEHYSSLVI